MEIMETSNANGATAGRIQPPRLRRGGPARGPDRDHPWLHGAWPRRARRRVGPAETTTATGNPPTRDLAKTWRKVWLGINAAICKWMNIHLQAILMFTRGTRFWPIIISEKKLRKTGEQLGQNDEKLVKRFEHMRKFCINMVNPGEKRAVFKTSGWWLVRGFNDPMGIPIHEPA